jgi:hypothetical protein
MGLMTSSVESPLAQIVSQHGTVVQLKGRGKSKPSFEYSETGMMGDIFELGTLSLLGMMIEAIFRNLEVDQVFELLEENWPELVEKYERLYRASENPANEYAVALSRKAFDFCRSHWTATGFSSWCAMPSTRKRAADGIQGR